MNINDELDYQPEMPADRTVAIGCIGSGFIMADCHLVSYRNAGFNPIAIASRRREKANEVASRHAIPIVHDDYHSLLGDKQVTVVDIAVPPDAQLEIIQATNDSHRERWESHVG